MRAYSGLWVAFVLAVLAAPPLGAQPITTAGDFSVGPPTLLLLQAPADDAPKNLKVLPKDRTRPQVVQVMQGFTAALAVGCNYCHDVPQGAPSDFASDDKKEKVRLWRKASPRRWRSTTN